MQAPDELARLVETSSSELTLRPALGDLQEPIRVRARRRGKRIRPVICLATTRSRGRDGRARSSGCARLELVHTFSLVHDDLPAMDDDDERRGRPSVHVAFGEGVALLAGDALLAEAHHLALAYGRSEPPASSQRRRSG